MSLQGMNAITGAIVQPSGHASVPSAISRQAFSPEVKTVEALAAVPADHLQKAVDEANAMFRQIRSDVEFVVDQESKKVVIKLVEQSSGEVINQYPSEQALAISKAITQMQTNIVERHAAFKAVDMGLAGLIVKQKT